MEIAFRVIRVMQAARRYAIGTNEKQKGEGAKLLKFLIKMRVALRSRYLYSLHKHCARPLSRNCNK